MNDAEMLEKMKDIVSDQLCINPKDIKTTSSLIEDLGCDSLDLVELAMSLEEEFDVEVPDERLEQIRTVQDAINAVKEMTAPSGTSASESAAE